MLDHSPHLACLQLPGLGDQHALVDQAETWPGSYWISTRAENTLRSAWLKSCAGRNIAAGRQGGGRSQSES